MQPARTAWQPRGAVRSNREIDILSLAVGATLGFTISQPAGLDGTENLMPSVTTCLGMRSTSRVDLRHAPLHLRSYPTGFEPDTKGLSDSGSSRYQWNE